MIVDTVKEVQDFTAEQIAPPPDIGDDVKASFIIGMAKLEEHVAILIDTMKMLSMEDIDLLDSVAENKAA